MGRDVKESPRSAAFLVAVLALVAAAAGTAVAGPGATTSAISKKKVKKVATKQINKLAPGLSVAHAESADTATDADNAENADSADLANSAVSAQSAVSARRADSVGGVSIEPVRIALPEGAPETPVASVGGSFVSVSNCGSGQITLRVGRPSAASPTVTAEWIAPAAASATHIAPGNFLSNNFAALGLSASIRQNSGRVTRVFVDGFYEANAFGGSDDCFAQGTIERFG